MKSEEAFSLADKNDNLGLCALMAAVPVLFFLPYVVKDKKYSPYCVFRANQTLVTLIIMILLGIAIKIIGILGIIPLVGLVFKLVCGILGGVAALYYLQNLILAILGSGKKVFIFGMIDLLK